MHAMRKSDLTTYNCNSFSQCRVENGSTNEFLLKSRVIEEFLKTVEGKYNPSVDRLHCGTINEETIYTIAGFIAYVMTCSPAAMRINSGPLQGVVEMTAKLLDKGSKLPPPPQELGGDSLTSLLNSGDVVIRIDPKYPQAIGITNILQRILGFGNFSWDVLLNEHEDCPFVTSDYPVGNEDTGDPRVLNRIVPLRPDLAIRIQPDLEFDWDRATYSFCNFKYRRLKPVRKEIVRINRLLVRCGESTVYYRDDSKQLREFVAKNRNYRIETRNTQIPSNGGILQISQQRVVPFAWS